MLSAILLYTLAAALVTALPGPDNALLLRNALRGGRSYALATVSGTATGLLCWGIAAALGLTALVTVSRLGYDLLRALGAGYLVLLGVSTWRHAGEGTTMRARPSGSSPSRLAGFRIGLATDLLNPKAGVFFVSFLPQFIPPGGNVAATTMLFALIQAILNLAWAVLLIALLRRLRRLFASSAFRRRLERATATVLVGFGLRLALERH